MTEPDIICNSHDAPDARTMILDLFAAYDGAPAEKPVLATKELLLVGDALNIAPTAVRTAVTRLKQEGRLQALGRGLYGYGDRIDPWRQRIDGWRLALTRRRAWDGSWLMAIVKPASLSRTAWRGTTRALEFEGFRRTPAGLWVRPDNLEGSDGARQQLLAYGATPEMTTARVTELDAASLEIARSLWDTDGVALDHRRLAKQIDESLDRIDGQASDAAAREALVLGRAGVRALIRDPLLPNVMADDDALQTLLASMVQYEKIGKAVWKRRFGIGGAHHV